MIGGIAFGPMWRRMMRFVVAPVARAASMYSSDFTCITDARNKRVVEYHPVKTRAATITQKDEPNTVIIAKPINTNGITCQVSMKRLIRVSTHPPK